MSSQSQLQNRAILTRRHFAASAGVAAALALASPQVQAENTASPLDPAETGARPEDLSPEEWAEVQGRYRNLLRVHGSKLSAEEKQRIIHILTANERMLSSIRAFEVQNGDPSACTLKLRYTKP